MIEFTWEVFILTGNIDTYLLYKALKNNDGKDKNSSALQVLEREAFAKENTKRI